MFLPEFCESVADMKNRAICILVKKIVIFPTITHLIGKYFDFEILIGMRDNFKRRGEERGLPIKCRCGAGSVIKTSEKVKNPERLFHCCPYGQRR